MSTRPAATRDSTVPGDGDVCCAGSDGLLLPIEAAQRHAAVFKALGDPTRVRLLRYLAESDGGTACACHLPAALGITQPTLSFHLATLRRAGLVTREQRGRWVHWSVVPAALTGAGAFLDLADRTDAPCC